MPSNRICLHLHISGHVQGVGFRASLEEKASALNLLGWVRNLRDGRVEALVQGAQNDVAAMREWCHWGPPAARVLAVTASEEAIDTDLSALHCISTA